MFCINWYHAALRHREAGAQYILTEGARVLKIPCGHVSSGLVRVKELSNLARAELVWRLQPPASLESWLAAALLQPLAAEGWNWSSPKLFWPTCADDSIPACVTHRPWQLQAVFLLETCCELNPSLRARHALWQLSKWANGATGRETGSPSPKIHVVCL